MMPISAKTANKELTWYYCAAHAELGISSNFSSIIAASWGFSPTAHVNHIENKFVDLICHPKQPVKKLCKIEQALAEIPLFYRRVLDASFNYYNYPPQIVYVFNEFSGAALFNPYVTNLDDLTKLCAKKAAKKHLTETELTNLRLIQAHSKQLYEVSVQRYQRERK